MGHGHLAQPVFEAGFAAVSCTQEFKDDLAHGGTHTPQFIAELQMVLKAGIPATEVHFGIKDRNALLDIVDGRLQQIAIMLDGGGGIVEEPHGATGMGGMALQQQRHDKTRRCHSNSTGQQMLGKAQHTHVCFHGWLLRHAALGKEFGKGLSGAGFTQIARHCLLKLFNGDSGSPQAETRSGSNRQFTGYKACGLDALNGRGDAAQGKANIGKNICGKTPQHTMA